MKIQTDDTVVWKSQAQGVWKEKRGRVIAIVPAGARVDEIFEKVCVNFHEIPKSRRKWADLVSRYDRAIVEVPRKSGRGCDYYAPRLSMLRKEETHATGRADG